MERLIKIKCTHISKSYLKFRHVPELSHSLHQGINPNPQPPPPHPPPKKKASFLFFVRSSANCPSPFLGNSPYILFFCDPPPLKIGEAP